MKPCNVDLRKGNQPVPRTCAECGLGPCRRGHAAADALAANVLVVGQTVQPLAGLNSLGLSRDCEAAMELALVRPDLLSTGQVMMLAQALKLRTRNANLSAIAQSHAALQAGQSQSFGASDMRVTPNGIERV